MSRKALIAFSVLQSLFFFSTAAIADLDLYEGGATGQWWNPTRNGEGFYVEIINNGGAKQIGVAMYTYDDSGEPLWIVGNIGIEPGDKVVDIPVFVFDGPTWGSSYDPADLNQKTFGTFKVQFPTCDTALFAIESDGTLSSGSYSLQRLTSVDGVGCVEPPPEPPPSGGPSITPGLWSGPGVCFMVSNDGTRIEGGNLSECGVQAAFDSELDGTTNEFDDCKVTASCEGVWPIVAGKFSCANKSGELVTGKFNSSTSAEGTTHEKEGGNNNICTAYWSASPD